MNGEFPLFRGSQCASVSVFIVCMFVCLKSYPLCDRLSRSTDRHTNSRIFPQLFMKVLFPKHPAVSFNEYSRQVYKIFNDSILEMPVESTSLYETVQCLSQASNSYKSIRPTTRPTLLATMTIKRNRLSHKKDTIHNFAVCNCYYFLL